LDVTLHPGDILFIPAYWWHWVFSAGESHGVNIFFDDKDATPLSTADNTSGKGSSSVLEPVKDEDDLTQLFAKCRQTSTPLCIREKARHWEIVNVPILDLLKMEGCPVQRYVLSQGHSLCPLEKPFPAYDDSGISYLGDAKDIIRHLQGDGSTTTTVQFTMPIRPQNANFLSMVRVPHFVPPKDVASINLWCSTKDLHTGLHYDGYSNMLVCTKGIKRVVLFPQSETPYLYNLPYKVRDIKAYNSLTK
jgi:hypothetical protein